MVCAAGRRRPPCSQRCPCSTPRNPWQRDFADVIELKILRGRNSPGWCGWADVIPRAHKNERGQSDSMWEGLEELMLALKMEEGTMSQGIPRNLGNSGYLKYCLRSPKIKCHRQGWEHLCPYLGGYAADSIFAAESGGALESRMALWRSHQQPQDWKTSLRWTKAGYFTGGPGKGLTQGRETVSRALFTSIHTLASVSVKF